MFLCVSFALAVIARRVGGALFLVRHPLKLDHTLSDDAMDMLDKGMLDVAHAWAGIVATQSELQEVLILKGAPARKTLTPQPLRSKS